MTSNVSNDVVRTLLDCVSLANFSSARSALVSCVASSPSRIERLRQFFVEKFAGGGAWSLNDDYEIIGDRPVVSTRANLVFRIRHVKLGVLILKVRTFVITSLGWVISSPLLLDHNQKSLFRFH